MYLKLQITLLSFIIISFIAFGYIYMCIEEWKPKGCKLYQIKKQIEPFYINGLRY